MKFKKYFKSFFKKSPSEKLRSHHKKKVAIFWSRFIRILTIKFIAFLTIFLFLFFFGVAYAQAPIHELIDQVTKPRPITQSDKVLPADIQQAIQNQAQQQIIQQKATALVATNTSGGSSQEQNNGINTVNPLTTQSFPTVQQPSLISNIVYPLQLFAATNSVDKAKLRLTHIDQEIQQVRSLLQTNASDNVVNQAVGIIQNIGKETGEIVADKNVQTDREVLTLQIEQYTRLQLILQKIEDTLPIDAYLKIDQAREKYLVSGAQQAINTAPNLAVINAIGISETRKIVGRDFAELKAIETLTDISSGLQPQAQQKLAGVQKQLALQFEKRILALSPDVRTRRLQNYIALSYGNPLNQVQAFNQMQHLLTDREMLLSVADLKEIALNKLEKRIFEIKTKDTRDQFITLTFKTPQQLEVLAQVKLDTSNLADATKKRQIADVLTNSQANIIQTLNSVKSLNAFFAPELAETPNILDISVANNLATVLENSSNISKDVKTDIQSIKQKILQNFASGVTHNNFLTAPKAAYNPVSENADVRILLPEPQAISLLEEIKSSLPNNEKSIIAIAQIAESNILVDQLLTKVNDPQVFKEDKIAIDTIPEVKQVLSANTSQSFFNNLDKKEKIIESQVKQEDQHLYETMQQITQAIFIANNNINEEKLLPQTVQTKIDSLKTSLVPNEIPKLDTPTDVTLTKVAVLPSDVQDALITTAKDTIGSKTNKNPLDIATEAKDLGVSVPVILPDNPLYPLENVIREVPLLLTTDPVQKAEDLIKIDNEKTIEAAKLVEQSQSTTSIDTAIKILESVKRDFETLQANVDQVKSVEQAEPAKVDALVNQVIDDGLARQIVFSSIENKIHGDSYVAVEEIRQAILKDGVDTLLAVTDNNIQNLTSKLEAAVISNTENSTALVANDIKAVELLNEIARTEPQSAQKVLQAGEATIATNLEKILLSQPTELRIQEVSTVSQEATGNPVRQFEALDVLKDDFKNPQTILLAEGLKDKATENLQARISEISNANIQNTFSDQVIGNQPQDLKAITEIASQVAPPQNAGIVDALPIVQQVNAIQADIVQNIVETYKDKPQELAKTDFFTNNPTPDVIDIKVAKELESVLSSSPGVSAEVVQVAKQEETKIINTFVENVSKPEFQVTVSANTQTSTQTPSNIIDNNTQTSLSTQSPTTISDQTNVSALAAQTLNASPDTLTTLLELKAQASPAEQTKIDMAIKTEITIIKDGLVNQTDVTVAQAAIAQIIDNPVVAKAVEQVSGQAVIQAVEQKSQIVQQQATQNQTQLQTAVASVQQEVFSTSVSNPSPVEQTLPQPVQQEIQQIKQEVPATQIPQVNVSTQTSTTVTVQSQPVDTTPVEPVASTPSTPAPASPSTEAPPTSAPAPIESKPAEQAAPASAAPAVEVPAAPAL